MLGVEVEELGDAKEDVSKHHLPQQALIEPLQKRPDNLWYQPPNQPTQGPKNSQEERNAQGNLSIQPPNIPNPQWSLSALEVPSSESVHIESLFNDAVIAQSNGNLEKAEELFEQVRKLDPNYRKGELAFS